MNRILKNIRWILGEQILGSVCAFVAFFIPGTPSDGLRSWLLVFGTMAVLGSAGQLFTQVYKPLKEKEQDDEDKNVEF